MPSVLLMTQRGRAPRQIIRYVARFARNTDCHVASWHVARGTRCAATL